MPTLKQIAAELGVSHTLVSRVASGRMGNVRVSEGMRKAITKRLQEVDFQPNRMAQALKSGRKGVVGVFLHKHGTPGSELNEKFIHAVSEELSSLGLRLWLRFFEKDDEFISACSGKLQREIDGLLLAGIAHTDLIGNLEVLRKKGLPVVCAFHSWDGDDHGITQVQVDQRAQGRLAARHLVEQGCQRIARFHLHRHRQEGFLQAMRDQEAEVFPELMIRAEGYDYAAGWRCMEKLDQSGIPFDGLSADSDALAAAAVHYLLRTRQAGGEWPKIMGNDNSPIAAHCAVPLTSVTSEIEERARMATRFLHDEIEGKPARSCALVPRLVVRESTESGGGFFKGGC